MAQFSWSTKSYVNLTVSFDLQDCPQLLYTLQPLGESQIARAIVLARRENPAPSILPDNAPYFHFSVPWCPWLLSPAADTFTSNHDACASK
jgi:hypothetical protein